MIGGTLMYNKAKFATQLKKILEKRGMAQRSLAEKLNTTEVSISRYVSGDRTPNIEMLVAIAQILNVSLDTLVGVEPPSQRRQPLDTTILVNCYMKATAPDRGVLWSLLDRYMTPEQRVIIASIQSEEKVQAV